jgi:hypothetical protein
VAVGVYYIYSNDDAEGGEQYGEVAVVFVQYCEHDKNLNELKKQKNDYGRLLGENDIY